MGGTVRAVATETRGRFRTRIGFLLTGIGFAVGLGNIWRFPQLTSQNGGAAFLFLYVPLVLLVGIPLLWAELAIGQRGQLSPMGAVANVAGRRWRSIGLLFVFTTFMIFGYYHVLAGMVLKYLVFSPTDALHRDPAAFLHDSVEGPGALLFAVVFILLTMSIVIFGVAKGLERANLIMMPTLFVILLGMAVYALSQPGAAAGLEFYLRFDPDQVTGRTVMAAVTQVFFSIGIAMGFHMTIASYTEPGKSMFSNATFIAVADMVVALIAGLVIFPLVFAQGLQAEVVGDTGTRTALFLTLPTAFASMGGFLGKGLMILFFLALTCAALSSTIANLEVIVSHLHDTFGWTRWKTAVIGAEFAFIPGVFAAFSEKAFEFIDAFFVTLLLLVGGFALCLMYTFAIKDRELLLMGGQDVRRGRTVRFARGAAFIVAFVAPIPLLVLLVLFILASPGQLVGIFG